MKLENIVPITELKRGAAELVKRATDQQSPIIITQNGRVTAVLEDIHSYERRQESLAMMGLCLQGQHDVAEGRTLTHREARRRIDASRARARTKSK